MVSSDVKFSIFMLKFQKILIIPCKLFISTWNKANVGFFHHSKCAQMHIPNAQMTPNGHFRCEGHKFYQRWETELWPANRKDRWVSEWISVSEYMELSEYLGFVCFWSKLFRVEMRAIFLKCHQNYVISENIGHWGLTWKIFWWHLQIS